MISKPVLLNVLAAFAISCLVTTLAAGPEDDMRLAKTPFVIKESHGLFIDVPNSPDFLVMNVRIYDMQGELVFISRSFGSSVLIDASDLEDGDFRYEAVSVLATDDPINNETTERDFGTFRIRDGRLEEDKPIGLLEDAFNRTIGSLLDLIIPTAHAADVFGQIESQDSSPVLLFDDTDGAAATEWAIFGTTVSFAILDSTGTVMSIDPQNNENAMVSNAIGDISLAGSALWIDRSHSRIGIGTTAPFANLHISDAVPNIRFSDESDLSQGIFQVQSDEFQFLGDEDNDSFFNTIGRIHTGAPSDSFEINSTGNAVFGGTVTSQGSSHVNASTFPRMFLNATSSENGLANDWAIGAFTGISAPKSELFIDNDQTDGSFSVIRLLAGDVADNQFRSMEVEADGDVTLASDAMTLQRSTGNVGVGVSSPSNPLHVQRTDTARILVENTSAVEAPREMLELSNAGNTKFIITNTQAVDPSSWGFTNNGDDFRISYQGSGVVEMQVFQGGNVTIDGMLTENSDRIAKTALRDLDQQSILDKVRGLNIQQWQYKDTPDANHIGPMAQDFYAAFGLGNSNTSIGSLDTSGVALLSIQALAANNEQLEQQNKSLETDNQALKAGHRELLRAYHAQQQELERLGRLEQEQVKLKQLVNTLLSSQPVSVALTAIN